MTYRSKFFELDADLKLTIDLKNHIVHQAEFIPSPNYDLRPKNIEVDLLVLHCISLPPGEFNEQSVTYITDLFNNKLNPNIHPYFKQIYQLKLSCHCFINRQGSLIQYVPFNYRAWHAGISCFEGKKKCNDFSIGIELEGIDHVPYTNKQYQTLIPLIKAILKNYPKITSNRIVGHSNIAPNRKTDPGPLFDWQLVYSNL